ncbi:hypothetical protein HK102_014220 [Quaeritorhiza haematococci]|nr:hypothetical protein HK102_014220 [Quaeritorhiza haematococci]
MSFTIRAPFLWSSDRLIIQTAVSHSLRSLLGNTGPGTPNTLDYALNEIQYATVVVQTAFETAVHSLFDHSSHANDTTPSQSDSESREDDHPILRGAQQLLQSLVRSTASASQDIARRVAENTETASRRVQEFVRIVTEDIGRSVAELSNSGRGGGGPSTGGHAAQQQSRFRVVNPTEGDALPPSTAASENSSVHGGRPLGSNRERLATAGDVPSLVIHTTATLASSVLLNVGSFLTSVGTKLAASMVESEGSDPFSGVPLHMGDLDSEESDLDEVRERGSALEHEEPTRDAVLETATPVPVGVNSEMDEKEKRDDEATETHGAPASPASFMLSASPILSPESSLVSVEGPGSSYHSFVSAAASSFGVPVDADFDKTETPRERLPSYATANTDLEGEDTDSQIDMASIPSDFSISTTSSSGSPRPPTTVITLPNDHKQTPIDDEEPPTSVATQASSSRDSTPWPSPELTLIAPPDLHTFGSALSAVTATAPVSSSEPVIVVAVVPEEEVISEPDVSSPTSHMHQTDGINGESGIVMEGEVPLDGQEGWDDEEGAFVLVEEDEDEELGVRSSTLIFPVL